jgi:hypothetical protein
MLTELLSLATHNTCHKEMSCHGHVTFATPTVRPDPVETPDDRKMSEYPAINRCDEHGGRINVIRV